MDIRDTIDQGNGSLWKWGRLKKLAGKGLSEGATIAGTIALGDTLIDVSSFMIYFA